MNKNIKNPEQLMKGKKNQKKKKTRFMSATAKLLGKQQI